MTGPDQVDEQDVSSLQLRQRARIQDIARESPAALDGQDSGTRDLGQLQFLQALADERGAVRHAQTVFTVSQLIVFDPGREGWTAGRRRSVMSWIEPTPRKDHVSDAQREDGQPERRETEEAKSFDAMA